MGTDWNLVLGAVAGFLAAATFVIVLRQEIRTYLNRPVCDWAADYQPLEHHEPQDDSIVSRFDLVVKGDSEARKLRMYGFDCKVLSQREGDAIVVLGPNQSTRVEVEVPRDKVDVAYVQLFYRTPPHRRGREELAWLPVTVDSPLNERVDEFKRLPWFRRLRWHWRYRAVPKAIPGGPNPRNISRAARRALLKRARATQAS